MTGYLERLKDLTQPADGNDRLMAVAEVDRLKAENERLKMQRDKYRESAIEESMYHANMYYHTMDREQAEEIIDHDILELEEEANDAGDPS